MSKHLRYASYLARHKWFVLVAGHRTGAPLWRLVIHDWTKFQPVEWRPYAHSFYGKRTDEIKQAFNHAWLHHQHRNPHHWQHWLLRRDSGEIITLEMPEKYVREMVADWMGAGRAKTGRWDITEWYEKNKDKIEIHPWTRLMVEELLHGSFS